jgi:hypothetical protein
MAAGWSAAKRADVKTTATMLLKIFNQRVFIIGGASAFLGFPRVKEAKPATARDLPTCRKKARLVNNQLNPVKASYPRKFLAVNGFCAGKST